MVDLKHLKDGSQGVRINYDIFKKVKLWIYLDDVKEELKDGQVILSQKRL